MTLITWLDRFSIARGRNFVKVKPMGDPNAQMSDSEKLLEAYGRPLVS